MIKDYEMNTQLIDLSEIKLSGRTLDIGGGGEGVIAKHTKGNVIIIDKRADELEETEDIGIKVVMDATDLKFLDNYFDNITCFYSFMYMSDEAIERVLLECRRVLREGGELHIWDTELPSTEDVILVPVEVKFIDDSISTTYGIRGSGPQKFENIIRLIDKSGMEIVGDSRAGNSFYIKIRK